MASARAIPVIALTGYLGAGKTSLLNHVLRTPDARIGVVINDFGEINVDAALIEGQIDEPASIAGGCICCLPDDGGLDDALARLAASELDLDVIVVEASGLADPVALSRVVGFTGVSGVRPGGVVDVVDAVAHFDTVDRDDLPPLRYQAASLVVVNKLDRVAAEERDAVVERVAARVRELNPRAHVVGAVGGRIDPALLFDVAERPEPAGQLSLRDLLLDSVRDAHPHDHRHADSVTVTGDGEVDPGLLADLLEQPPAGVYRLKGVVRLRGRPHVVNVVGDHVHIAAGRRAAGENHLVAIGAHLDVDAVRGRMAAAIEPITASLSPARYRRIRRYTQA